MENMDSAKYGCRITIPSISIPSVSPVVDTPIHFMPLTDYMQQIHLSKSLNGLPGNSLVNSIK